MPQESSPKSPSKPPPRFLSHDELRSVVRLAPLVAIDLVIRNARGEALLGLRNNEPAKGFYFVPGGMIRKNETLAAAFARLLKNETNFSAKLEDARPLGAYEHFYDNNRFGDTGYGTHYVVLGYELNVNDTTALASDTQHSELRWWSESELLRSPQVHDNAKAYFR
jgi:colanic acid biosynthesis protein WcaH